ncbi:MAG: protein kinase [Tannerellaceae bacterium]|jgi:serine/threonine protein kinase|nr:protein kinase [Tannerellaceae bacterium]
MNDIATRCDYQPGDYINGKYFVEKSLGEGSFGKVFKVKDAGGNAYALKLLRLWEVHPEIRQQLVNRFDMEFETGQIQSRYLVQSVAHGFTEGNPFIVMEFCSKGDLMHLVETSDPDLLRIGRQVLYGLKDLHRCGKVHRDLKPENVLIKEDGVAALTDFGISGDRNKRMTERNILGKPTQIFGTYAYMPPEQVTPKRGESTVLPTTDIFSYGVMMYQLLTGELPFGKLENENDLAHYIRRGREAAWNRESLVRSRKGSHFRHIIEGCLVPDFKTRLQTVDEVLNLFPQQSHVSLEPPQSQPDFQREVVRGVLLRIMQGEAYGQVYKLNDLLTGGRRILTLGRKDSSVSNAVAIEERQSNHISRRHCTLEWDAYEHLWYIRDGQWDKSASNGWRTSLNGTYINSSEVAPDGRPFYPGDIISVGDMKLRAEGY